ncbi:hypothetical protein [Paracoccus sp. (in: a-proteobacteria)]|uniref:hypothetical protein n=1 Tax=Paracoccus sp. TaxID=267 RepID=UPI00396C6041
MPRPNDPDTETTEADRTSQTRFGPRPVPKGHRTASPKGQRKTTSSRIPPSGKVSPDGRRAWPEPSMTAKVVVWGGVALGVAGLAAATSLAARALIGSDDPAPRRSSRDHDRQRMAPRFATMDEDERDEIRRRVQDQAREDARQTARLRAEAGRGSARPHAAAAKARPQPGNVAKDLTKTANELSQSLNGVAQSLVAAFTAFRGVSQQATTIVGDFVTAADQLKAILRGGAGQRPDPVQDPAREPAQRDDDRMHRL